MLPTDYKKNVEAEQVKNRSYDWDMKKECEGALSKFSTCRKEQFP